MSDGTEKTHLAATHLELGLTSGVLLHLDDYAISGQSRTLLREASFLLVVVMKSRTSLISLGYTEIRTLPISGADRGQNAIRSLQAPTYHSE